jgi:hypothetical protein
MTHAMPLRWVVAAAVVAIVLVGAVVALDPLFINRIVAGPGDRVAFHPGVRAPQPRHGA